MHILIVKLGSIGDIVHTLPSLARIRRGLPSAEITWLADVRSSEILRENPMLDRLIESDARSSQGGKRIEEIFLDIGREVRRLRGHSFDIALDFQGLLKSAAAARLSGARSRWGFSRAGLREPASRFLLTSTVDVLPQTHVVRKNLRLAEAALGLEPDDDRIEFPIATGPEHVSEAEAMIEAAGDRFAILNPAGGWVTKLWHAEKYGELADRIWSGLGLVPLVVTGPGEEELSTRVLAGSRSGRAMAVRPTLKGFYELARRAAVYVGGDTGPTHIALAAGTPVVGIFGPTEWWRNGSINPLDICVERSDIGCRVDCHRRTCGKWICMDISVDTVFSAVEERLKKV